MCMRMCVHALEHSWRSENNVFQELALSFHHMSPGIELRLSRLTSIICADESFFWSSVDILLRFVLFLMMYRYERESTLVLVPLKARGLGSPRAGNTYYIPDMVRMWTEHIWKNIKGSQTLTHLSCCCISDSESMAKLSVIPLFML